MIQKLFSTLKKNSFLFISTLLGLAFPLGLIMLIKGPTRLVAKYAQEEKWSLELTNFTEKLVILFFLFLVLILSIYVTFFLAKKSKSLKRKSIAFFIVLLLTSLGIFSFSPQFLIDENQATEEVEISEAEFYFGGYPDEFKLIQLKKENYTAVISLLNKLVVPAEPILIDKENKLAKKIGVEIISIPMLPWIIENDAAIEKIKKLAKKAKGKYYVHCYLGKDRANVFKNILQSENQKLAIKGELSLRLLDTLKSFERGKIIKVKNRLYITPFPTDEEFFGFILNGNIKNVISIVNPKNVTERNDLEREKKILKQYNTNFIHLPYKHDKDCHLINDTVAKLEKPILIHSYKTDSNEINQLLKLLNK